MKNLKKVSKQTISIYKIRILITQKTDVTAKTELCTLRSSLISNVMNEATTEKEIAFEYEKKILRNTN